MIEEKDKKGRFQREVFFFNWVRTGNGCYVYLYQFFCFLMYGFIYNLEGFEKIVLSIQEENEIDWCYSSQFVKYVFFFYNQVKLGKLYLFFQGNFFLFFYSIRV